MTMMKTKGLTVTVAVMTVTMTMTVTVTMMALMITDSGAIRETFPQGCAQNLATKKPNLNLDRIAPNLVL